MAGKEYNYEYDEGKIVRATECIVTLNGVALTPKTVVNSIRYYYDSEGKVTKKVITPADGTAQTIYYKNNDDNAVIKFSVPAPTEEDPNKTRLVTAHSKTDSFGRKVFDEVQFATGCVSRHFSYHGGNVPEEHTLHEKVKSAATTQLVKQIVLSDGHTLCYEYDAEEHITSVADKYTEGTLEIIDTTLYTYDALGQLLTETNKIQTTDRSGNEPVVNIVTNQVNEMTYDNYGNILSKNGKQYCYDATWRDLLTCYDGQCIDYDAQGNPTYYLGHTLTWEKGRQLKSFDNNTYTYNANGIRTSKTINGVKHEYVLDGTKILRETWGENILIPIYDNEESVCGIIYNGVPHYFLKNLQGDIIAIANSRGEVEARYTYDAWGAITNISGTDEGISIAVVNPFRYRSYYYDVEIGLYYLQSRYYDVSTSRFVSADEAFDKSIIGLALFTYCINNIVKFYDPFGKYSIVIDPGHGGSEDTGSIGQSLKIYWGRCIMFIKKTYYEKDFNLKVSKLLIELLKNTRNYSAHITRSNDQAMSLEARYKYANKLKADIFVSVHHNSSRKWLRQHGYCVLYAGKHDVSESKKLAKNISNAFKKHTKLSKYSNPKKRKDLAVLNGTKMPAVLVECGYMGLDLEYCRDNADKIAYAIYRGIKEYLS